MERKLKVIGDDGRKLLVALGIVAIRCLPQLIDYVHETASRMMDEGYTLDIHLGAFSLRFGRET